MFDKLIAEYGAKLFALCFHLTGSREDAEDLYQDTWMKAYRAHDRYDSSRPFEAWINRICVNTYRDKLRRSKLKDMFAIFATNEEKDRAMQTIVAPPGEEKDADLAHAIQLLPENERICVVLYYFQDQDIKTMAQTLGISEGTIKSRLYQARQRLKKELSKHEP